jgi:hypothetical protein
MGDQSGTNFKVDFFKKGFLRLGVKSKCNDPHCVCLCIKDLKRTHGKFHQISAKLRGIIWL